MKLQQLFFLLLLLVSFQVKSNDWVFQFEKQGIKVYTKDIRSSSFDAFKGECLMHVSITEIAKTIMNIDSYPEWCYQTTSAKIMRVSNNEIYYRYVSETPPLIKHREGYFVNKITRSVNSDTILIKMDVYKSTTPVPEGFIRIPKSDGLFLLHKIDNNITRVTFEMAPEAGGNIPGWLANLVATESPIYTLSHLDNYIKNKK